MEQFYLNPKTVYNILRDKGVTNFYHANTLLTSLTFIQQRALLSRGYVAGNNLIQTEQRSDAEDIRYHVWDDVFMDGLDLHKRFNRPNDYGPVLFVMKLEVLLMPELCPILVTKANPWYWYKHPKWESRYFKDTNELKEMYLTPKIMDSYCMFTFRSPEKTIKLNKYLQEIIIDKPRLQVLFKDPTDRIVGQTVHDKIKESLDANGLGHIPVSFRHKDEKFSWCKCNLRYTQLRLFKQEEFVKRFKEIVRP